jgi:outer membrane receptor protein involved in Fe transport
MQAKAAYIGSELVLKLNDGFRLENRNRYTSFNQGWDANPTNGVATFQSIANSFAHDSKAGYSGTNPGIYAAATTDGTNYAYHLVESSTGTVISSAKAATLNGNGLGQNNNLWHTERVGDNIQDDIRLINTFNDGKTTLTGGLYYSSETQTQLWDGVQALIDTSKSSKRYDLVFDNATTGNPIGQYTWNGLSNVGSFDYADRIDTQKDASIYVNFEQKVGNLTLDAGLRHTHLIYEWTSVGAVATDMNTVPIGAPGYNPAIAAVGLYNGQTTTGRVSEDGNAWTAGGNYQFSHELAVFARYSEGPRYHDVSQAVGYQDFATMSELNNSAPIEKIKQEELGVKFVTKRYALFATLFEMKQTNLTNNDILADGSTLKRLIGMKTQGVELEGTWNPVRGLVFDLRATLQNPELTAGTDKDINGNPVSIKGNVPTRLPKAYGNIAAIYSFEPTSWGTFSLNGSVRYTGKIATTNADFSYFSAYEEVALGVAFDANNGFTYRIDVQNALDSTGITEGDPRATGAASASPYFNARPILPRSIVASINYKF